MHSFLSKTLVILTLWSGTGLAVTSLPVSQAMEQSSLGCLGESGTIAAANPCQSYVAAVTAALAAG